MQGSLLCQNFVNIKMNWSEKMRVKVPKNGIESCKLTAKKNSARKHSPCSPYTWTFYLIALRHWPFSDVRRLFFAISFYILFQFLRSLFFSTLSLTMEAQKSKECSMKSEISFLSIIFHSNDCFFHREDMARFHTSHEWNLYVWVSTKLILSRKKMSFISRKESKEWA